MKSELSSVGVDVNVVAINDAAASETQYQQELIDRCSFPLLQDTDKVGAYKAMSGNKDDIYIYDKDGKLAVYLPILGDTDINLSKPEGYLNVKSTLMTLAKR